jgi:hypothetical protein
MFASVSLGLPSRVAEIEILKHGGLLETPLKKLKGARLASPLGEMVDTQAIGRGTILAMSSW